MPEISRFFGIIVTMYYADHSPPHFHAKYQGQKGLIGIEPLVLLEGNLSSRAVGLVMEWAKLHNAELRENWELAREAKPLKAIVPLD